MESQPPQDTDAMRPSVNAHLLDDPRLDGPARLRLAHSAHRASPEGKSRSPEASKWAGFVAIDLGHRSAVTREHVQRLNDTISLALQVRRGASSRCSGSVITAVFNVAGKDAASLDLLDRVAETVSREFEGEADVVRSSIDYSDPDGVQVEHSSQGSWVRLTPTLVRET